jgi:diamine N-acetyltransferase
MNLKTPDISEVELILDLMQAYYDYDGIIFDRSKSGEALRELLLNDTHGKVWFIQEGGDTAGYLVLSFGFSLEFHGRYAFIDELYVLEKFRGRGIGSATLRLLEEEARRLGVKSLHLEVEDKNTAAQSFYSSLGYRSNSRFLMFKELQQRR